MPSTKRESHRGSFLKGVAVYRVLYQSILNAKLTGRKNLGRKRCTSNRDDCKLENTVKQSWFKHLWELHKEWTEAGVSASRVTTLRRLQEKGYQATSEPETTSEASYLGCGEKGLSGPKSSFQMKVNFAFNLETRFQSLGEEWRGTDSMLLEVQCEVSTVSDDLGCHVICWCWCTVFSEVHSQRSHLPGNFRALHASCFLLLTSFMEMLISFSSRTWHLPTLPKVPKAGSMTMVLLCLIGQQTRLTWTP